MLNGHRHVEPPLKIPSDPPIEVEAEVVSVHRDSVFVMFESNVNLAIRVPPFPGVAIGMRRRADIYFDGSKPKFVCWRGIAGTGSKKDPDPPGISIPPPPPGGCPPPGQPLPTSQGPGQEAALHRIIEGLLDGLVPRTKENKRIYKSLAYLVRRAEGQGLLRGLKEQ